MTRWIGVVLVGAFVAGCQTQAFEVGPEPSKRTLLEERQGRNRIDTGIEGTTGRAIPYSCDGLPRVTPAAARAHPVTTALLGVAPIGSPAPTSATGPVAGALAAASSVPLDTLSSRDRILIQASALRVARGDSALATTAAEVVKRMAFDSSTLEGFGSDPRSELEPWIGSAEGWRERRGLTCGPAGVHDAAYSGELAFRTVRSGSRRVIFAQVVALDTELAPHVTPFVGLVELRDGMRADSPACILEARGEGLATSTFDQLHTSPFVQPMADGTVGCGGCHTGRGPNNLGDLGREEGGAFRIERRITLLERARARANEVRALAGEGASSAL